MSVSPNPLRYIEARLELAFAEPWDDKRPARAELLPEGEKVGLRFFAMKRTGVWVMVHEEPPVLVLTEEDADTLLARALSIFLMKHPAWPY